MSLFSLLKPGLEPFSRIPFLVLFRAPEKGVAFWNKNKKKFFSSAAGGQTAKRNCQHGSRKRRRGRNQIFFSPSLAFPETFTLFPLFSPSVAAAASVPPWKRDLQTFLYFARTSNTEFRRIDDELLEMKTDLDISCAVNRLPR